MPIGSIQTVSNKLHSFLENYTRRKIVRLIRNWFEINEFFTVYLFVCVFLKRKGKIYSVPIRRVYHNEGRMNSMQENEKYMHWNKKTKEIIILNVQMHFLRRGLAFLYHMTDLLQRACCREITSLRLILR